MSDVVESHEVWTARVKAAYPKVLGPPHPWGYLEFAINPGWRRIVEEIAEKLERFKNPPKAVQIKEKFGGLRFYVDASSTEIERIISEGEARASKTCEVCGEPGKLVNQDGWLSVSCGEHKAGA